MLLCRALAVSTIARGRVTPRSTSRPPRPIPGVVEVMAPGNAPKLAGDPRTSKDGPFFVPHRRRCRTSGVRYAQPADRRGDRRDARSRHRGGRPAGPHAMRPSQPASGSMAPRVVHARQAVGVGELARMPARGPATSMRAAGLRDTSASRPPTKRRAAVPQRHGDRTRSWHNGTATSSRIDMPSQAMTMVKGYLANLLRHPARTTS